MSNSTKTNKYSVLEIIGLVAMIVLALTKIVPTSQIAGYSLFIGIAFFFITEIVNKTPPSESGLRFKSFFADLKKPGVLIWLLLPMVSSVATLFVGDFLFDGSFSTHVMGRTSSMLSFDKIQFLVFQVIITAFGEEIAWRGFFVGKAMKKFPFWLCAVVSAFLFAFCHMAVGNFWLVFYDIATIFIDGIIYAIVFKKSGNCLLSTVSHILCNGIGIAAALIFK